MSIAKKNKKVLDIQFQSCIIELRVKLINIILIIGGNMKLFEIKHKLTGAILFKLECESLKICVETAVNEGVDLGSANLRFANLRAANLRFANLESANLRFANLISANLVFADLDFSSGTPLHCGGLNIKKGRKQIIQDIYHTASNMKHYLSENKDDDLQKIFEIAEKLQDEFHKIDEVGKL